MSNIDKYVEFVRRWEGKWGRGVNDSSSKFPCPTPNIDPKDGKLKYGWHTSNGIAYKTWVAEFGTTKDKEFFEMPSEMWWRVFKKRFWNKVSGDSFNFGIAVLMTDIAWMSGISEGVDTLQDACKILGSNIKDDGDMGPKTIAAANSHDPRKLFDFMIIIRKQFYDTITNPDKALSSDVKAQYEKNKTYYKGWINRLNDIKAKFRP